MWMPEEETLTPPPARQKSPVGERLGEFVDQRSKAENPEQKDLERVYEGNHVLKKKYDLNSD